jgi:hypothetical protein
MKTKLQLKEPNNLGFNKKLTNFFKLPWLVILVLFFFAAIPEVHASHYRFGNITWSVDDNDANTINFKVKQAWRNSSYGNPAIGSTVNTGQFGFGDGNSTSIDLIVLSNNPAEDWMYGEFTVSHTYANAGDFIASFQSCCRIGSLSNNANGSFRNETIVNLGTGNNSPLAVIPVILNMGQGAASANFQILAIDPDGDDVQFRLATSSEYGGTSQPTGLSVSTSGELIFNTTSLTIGQLYNAAVVVEDLDTNGNIKTKIIVDFIIKIIDPTIPPPAFSVNAPEEGSTIIAYCGQEKSFVADVTGDGSVTLATIGAPLGSVFTPALPVSGNQNISTVFTWTPTNANLGNNLIAIIATDDTGPQTTRSFIIQVIDNSSDDDGDGYTVCGGDCDDTQASINPGQVEIIGNNIDDNCDGLIDILPYCVPVVENCSLMWINNVMLESINNTSGDGCIEGGYSDYTAMNTTLIPGTDYTISITGNPRYPQSASVFVDWNVDGDFYDAGEQVASGVYLPNNSTPGSANFTVPSTALGSFRLRVISSYNGYGVPNDPCSVVNGSYGEAEDYTINTIPPCTAPIIACTGNISVSNDRGMCGANVTYNDATASGTSPTLIYSHASGSYFPVGTTTVTATATNDCGSDICTFDVTITNILPESIVDGIVSSSQDPIQAGEAFNLSANFNDDNLTSATWYFSSDGDFTNGDVAEHTYTGTIAGGIVSGSFNFDASYTGVYSVKVVVEDACGEPAETGYNSHVVVYDPSGGFVTGGGWIYSPEGALAGSSAEGKLNYGFNAKYKTGKNNRYEVDGNTNFQFKEGDFHFKSSSHDAMSLAISGEKKATYRGRGTVNGNGDHKFMVTVIDGDAPGGDGTDRFRIMVWETGNSSTVLYDNERTIAENADASTAIGGGSIVIHKSKGKGKGQEVVTKDTPLIMQDLMLEILGTLTASPNPGVTFSTVRFSLKEDANVVLRVYDYSGRMIETLYNGQAKAYQNYDVDFQRRNLMSGIYIVKLTTDKGQSYDKRIIIE